MKRRLFRLSARVAGVGMILLVLWLVGLDDTVTAVDGSTHHGRIVSGTGAEVVLVTDNGEQRIAIRKPSDARIGLIAAFLALGDRPGLAVVGVLCHLLAICVTYYRWGILLRGADLATPWRTVLQLGWVGQFIGSVLPGGIGTGDLVKAFHVARTHDGRKTRAIVTVFVDRVVGLFVLCIIAVVAVLFAPPGSTLATARNVVVTLFAVGAVGVVLLLSERTRHLLRVTHLLRRLPFQNVIAEVGQAIRIYRGRPWPLIAAALLSLAGHGLFLSAFCFYGAALGQWMAPMAVLVAIPVAQIIAAVPGLPGGWGVGDIAFLAFLPETGVPPATAVALSFTYRILQTVISLPGGFWLFRHRVGVHVDEIEREMGPAIHSD